MTTDKLPTEAMIIEGGSVFAKERRGWIGGALDREGREAAAKAIYLAMEAVRPPVGEGWQPIKTAPKDGTLIIGREGSFVISLLWRDIYKGFVSPMKVGWEQVIEPTHWMPILAMQSNG
jgi:hypothetical protein